MSKFGGDPPRFHDRGVATTDNDREVSRSENRSGRQSRNSYRPPEDWPRLLRPGQSYHLPPFRKPRQGTGLCTCTASIRCERRRASTKMMSSTLGQHVRSLIALGNSFGSPSVAFSPLMLACVPKMYPKKLSGTSRLEAPHSFRTTTFAFGG